MWDSFVAWVISLAGGILELFPVVDMSEPESAFAQVGRLVAWIAKLNQAFPVVEGLTILGIVLGVVSVLYMVMLVRRVFSLLWPGAGS